MNHPSQRNTSCRNTIRNTSQCTPSTVATQGSEALGMSRTRMASWVPPMMRITSSATTIQNACI